MFSANVIDGIVSSLKKMEQKLREYSAIKAVEAEDALKKADAANTEVERASKIAGNLSRLLGE